MLKIANFKSKYLENCHKYEKVVKKILDQNNSVGSGEYRKFPNEKNPKKIILSYSIFEKTQISIKIY